jgi:hypothetical protein
MIVKLAAVDLPVFNDRLHISANFSSEGMQSCGMDSANRFVGKRCNLGSILGIASPNIFSRDRMGWKRWRRSLA